MVGAAPAGASRSQSNGLPTATTERRRTVMGDAEDAEESARGGGGRGGPMIKGDFRGAAGIFEDIMGASVSSSSASSSSAASSASSVKGGGGGRDRASSAKTHSEDATAPVTSTRF